MGSPLELIKYDAQTGQFEVGKEAVAALRHCKSPVGVVAVCGRARQGKSFILNQLLQQTSGGFQVASTHRPCTKGLWMWSTPQRRVGADGSDYYLVLLDTEGIDAYDQTTQYSTQIFSLAVLLSSLFVYNQMGGIDEAALDRLSLITEMTKRIRVRANNAGNSDDELAGFTPSLLWLLRDFYLTLEEDGHKITPRDYLETALHPVTGNGDAVAAKNQIRASIKSLFPDRDCFSLVRPMHDEAALVNMDRCHRSQLRPEFQEGVDRLLNHIFARGQPKRVGSQIVTGPVLAGLVEAYVAAINAGAVPTIATAWQGVAEAECRRAVDAAEECYCATFSGSVAAEEAEMEREHRRALEAALVVYAENAVGDERIRRAHERRLREAADNRFMQLRARKLAEAAAAVNDMLYKANVQISNELRKPDCTVEQLQAQLSAWTEQYLQHAAGPSKWQRLLEFLQATYPAVTAELVGRSEARSRSATADLRNRLDSMTLQLQDAQRQLSMAEASMRSETERSSDVRRQLMEKLQEAGQWRVSAEDKDARLAALEAQLREAYLVNEQKVHGVAEAAEARVTAVQLEQSSRLAALRAELEAEQRAAAEARLRCAAAETRARALDGQLAAAMSDCTTANGRWQAAEATAAKLVQERDEALDRARVLSALQRRLEADRDAALGEAAAQRSVLSALDMSLEAQLTEAQHQVGASKAGSAAVMMAAVSVAPGRGGQAHRDENVSPSSALLQDVDIEAMTIPSIRDWLTDHGHADDVWVLNNRKPAPKRADWVALLSDRSSLLS